MVAHLALGLQKLFSPNLSPFTTDVMALHDFYRALNNLPVLKGWQSDGGYPCEESWDGVSCAGSSVIYLKLHSLNLFGCIPEELYTLFNLKHLNLACNNLVENIPYSLPLGLQYLNVSHILFSGPVGDVLPGLENLREGFVKELLHRDDQNPSDAKLFPSQIILYHMVEDEGDLSQQCPNHFRQILMVGAVVGLGALMYLSAQPPNHRTRKEPRDDDLKKREPPKKHLFVNPKIKDLRPAPFSASGFRPTNYLAIEDGKAQESVDAAALRKKKGVGS